MLDLSRGSLSNVRPNSLTQSAEVLLLAVKSLLQQYGEVYGYEWESYYERLYQEACANHATVALKQIAHMAQHLWTSAQKMTKSVPHTDTDDADSGAVAAAVVPAHSGSTALCSVINAAIRVDNPRQIIHVVAIARAINQLCVTQKRGSAPLPFPTGGVCYRGTSFDNQFRDFFAVGKRYRVPVRALARQNHI